MDGISASDGFGKFNLNEITGKVTLIYTELNDDEIKQIIEAVSRSEKENRLTRVVIVESKWKEKKMILDENFKIIYRTEKFVMRMIENSLCRANPLRHHHTDKYIRRQSILSLPPYTPYYMVTVYENICVGGTYI